MEGQRQEAEQLIILRKQKSREVSARCLEEMQSTRNA